MKIRKDFKELIPPLSPEEFEQLEKNILEEGIRDPLVVWNGVLVDGHNRYEIAKKHGLDYETVERDFCSEDEARAWIIQNQLGRRNLSKYDRSVMALRLKEPVAEKAEKRMLSGKTDPMQKSAQGATRDELANIAGVSHDTIRKVEIIEEKATPRTKQLLREGKLSINQAYNSVHPKAEDPVKKAKKEHEQFQEAKKEHVVDFKEVQKDKLNTSIIDSKFVEDFLEMINAVKWFEITYAMYDLSRLAELIEEDEKKIITGQISTCLKLLREIKECIRR